MNDNYWSKDSINKRLFGIDLESDSKPTVILTSGQQVKVNLAYLAEFLEDNKDIIQVKYIDKRGAVRNAAAN